MTRSPFIMLAAAALLGCDGGEPPLTGTCSDLSECPLGEVCDELGGRCVPEPNGGIVGSFTCVVDGLDVAEANGAFLGSVRGERVALVDSVGCFLVGEEGSELVAVIAQNLDSPVRFQLVLPANEPDASARLGPPLFSTTIWTATLFNADSERVAALSTSGVVEVDGATEVGSRLRGYVQVDLEAPSPTSRVGQPCERLAECGDSTDLSCRAGVCSLRCGTDAQCRASGDLVCAESSTSVALERRCLVPCRGDEDCPPGLACLADYAGAVRGCERPSGSTEEDR